MTEKKSYFREVSFRIWLRIEIFKRILKFYKNKKIYIKNTKFQKNKIKFYSIYEYLEKVLEKIKIHKSNEIDYCRSLAKFIIFRVRLIMERKNRKICNKFNLVYNKLLDSNIQYKRGSIDTSSLLLGLVGKIVILEGIITKVKSDVQNTVSVLIECEKCRSFFYFALDRLNQIFPFLCSKANCSSKKFFVHFKRVLTENLKKIKLGGILLNFKKIKFSDSIVLEIYGNETFLVFPGLKLICTALVKVYPLQKKNFSFFKKNYLFGMYMQTRKWKPLFFDFIGTKEKFFLTKKDFLIIHKIISTTNIFHLLVKNVQPLSCWNEGLKAFLLLSVIQQSNFYKKATDTYSLKLCIVLSNIINEFDPFIKEILIYFPKCFFFNIENFKTRFNKSSSIQRCDFNPNQNKFKGCILLIDCGLLSFQNLKANKVISDVKNILGKNQPSLKNCIIILYFRLEKKNPKKLVDLEHFFNKLKIISGSLDPIYVLKKIESENIGKSRLSPFVNYYFKKNKIMEKDYLMENKIFIKTSMFNSLICKKKISILFLKKYLVFVKSFPDSNLSKKSLEIIIQFYKNTKTLNFNFWKIGYDFLQPVIKLSQCRAKIDLREVVSTDDVLDSIEILLDSRPKLLKDFHQNFKVNFPSCIRKIDIIYKFLRLMNKFFSRNKQSLFEANQLEENLKNKIKFSEIEEILEKLKFVKNFKGTLFSLNIQ